MPARWCPTPVHTPFDAHPWVALVNNMFCYMLYDVLVHMGAAAGRVGVGGYKILLLFSYFQGKRNRSINGRDREREREQERERARERERQRQRETERYKEIQRDTERYRETERDRERQREIGREIPPLGDEPVFVVINLKRENSCNRFGECRGRFELNCGQSHPV